MYEPLPPLLHTPVTEYGSAQRRRLFSDFLKKNVRVRKKLSKHECFSSQTIMGQRGLLTFDDDVKQTSAKRKQ
jgi:hypothetical protein